MNKNVEQEKIANLVIRGKDQGYLNLNEIHEALPNSMTQDKIALAISKLNSLGIKIIKPKSESIIDKDSDAEQFIDLVSELLIPDTENKNNNKDSILSGYVEIRDHSLWIKHIYEGKELQDYLLNMEQNTLIELEVGDKKGHWIKMSDGKDGRKTNGIKPVGTNKKYWLDMQTHRGELISIKKI